MRRALFLVAAVAVLAGIFFRWHGLGSKLYTNDEATTSVHVSGHTLADYLAASRAGRIATVSDALLYQHIDPRTSTVAVIRSLAIEDPQHPPLFYVLERAWERIFGTSLAARRSLPALFGTLGIVAGYFFAVTLSRSKTTAVVFASLVAVSPFHIVYAQQAREYSLWTLLLFLGSTALLRALRSPSLLRWAIYAALTVCALYTDVLFLFTLLAQALYVVVAYRAQLRSHLLPFAIAACAALAAFAPWLRALVRGAQTVTNNTYLGAPLSLELVLLKWSFNAGTVFYDVDYVWHASAVLLLPIFALVAVGSVMLVRSQPRRVWLYVAALGFVTAVAFIVPDILHHESRSTGSRYQIPTWIALEVAAAYALAHVRSRRLAAGAFLCLIACGVASASVAAGRESWWGDPSVAPIGPIARVVRGARPPVTVVFKNDGTRWDFAAMELANVVPGSVRLELLQGRQVPTLARGRTFVLDPSPTFVAELGAHGFTLTNRYRFETADATLRALQSAAASARGSASVDTAATLWEIALTRRSVSDVPASRTYEPAFSSDWGFPRIRG